MGKIPPEIQTQALYLFNWLASFDVEEDWLMTDDLIVDRKAVELAVACSFVKIHRLKKGCSGWDIFQLLPKGRLWVKQVRKERAK